VTEHSNTWGRLRNEIVHCTRCPRLVRYRRKVAREKKRQYMNWNYWGAPLPGFGEILAELVIVGLAPAAHGGNRTGRMFTGDGSASFLMQAMHRAGFANQPKSDHRGDGLMLTNAFMTAAVRCPPPRNKPSKKELMNCSAYLDRELALLSRARVILMLGHIAFKGCLHHLRRKGLDVSGLVFKHGEIYRLPKSSLVLIVSYHPSRQNTQTGRLTHEMMDRTLQDVRIVLERDERESREIVNC